MEKRIHIPQTDLSLFPVGFGAVGPGAKWPDNEAYKIMDAYVDRGGNLIDTARIYADGHSEEAIGRWLRGRGKRSDIVISSKGGHPLCESMHVGRMSQQEMTADLHASLKALGTDYIDLYYYHRDDESVPVEMHIDLMESFVRQGKIRYYGCSNWKTERLAKAAQYAQARGYRGFAANQALQNIGSPHMKPLKDDTLVVADNEMLAYHKAHAELLAMPYFSVCRGFFHTVAAGGDYKHGQSEYATPKNLHIAQKLMQLMEKYGASVSQVVLGHYFQLDFAIVPLYGPRNTETLLDALAVLEVPFTKEDYAFLRE